jgi:hypothetical protein
MGMHGPRVRVPTPSQNARQAFFGALEAIGGQGHWADYDRKLAVHFVAFLDQLLTAYPVGPLYLVLDNALTHTAKVVARWAAAHPRAQLLWLPTYAAHEANPVERLWGLLKSAVSADRLEGEMTTLVGYPPTLLRWVGRPARQATGCGVTRALLMMIEHHTHASHGGGAHDAALESSGVAHDALYAPHLRA